MSLTILPGNPEWHTPRPSKIWAPVLEEIIRLRRLMLVHSCIYYWLNDSLVSDHLWQAWADQLCYFQDDQGWRAGFYDQAFSDWTAATGAHLPVDEFIHLRATRLLSYRDKPPKMITPHQPGFF